MNKLKENIYLILTIGKYMIYICIFSTHQYFIVNNYVLRPQNYDLETV